MATRVHMEALSPTMEEGQIVSWLKAEGDEVSEGDVLAEIETDKATMELVARGSGVLRKQILAEGDTAAVGTVIGVIAAPDEDVDEILGQAADGGGEGEAPEPAEAGSDAVGSAADTDEDAADADEVAAAGATAAGSRDSAPEGGRADRAAVGAGAVDASGDGGRIKASPLARRLADDAGVELRGVRGSGPGGRITKKDIESAIERGASEPAAAPSGGEAATEGRLTQPVREGPEVEEVPVSQMRKTIARRLVTSIGPVPTFYLTVDIDMTRMMEARERINARLEKEGLKVSVNDLILKTTALALRRHPEVNAQWQDDHIKRFHRVHLGVAVAVEDGLITPVVRDADRKGAARIGTEVRELAGRARERKLQPEEYTGATFSVSNLGMFGIEEFTAIINPPEAGILAIGAVEDRVTVEDGEAVIAPRMKMTMSCDHRVVDGATGARFLQTLRGLLEEPGLALA